MDTKRKEVEGGKQFSANKKRETTRKSTHDTPEFQPNAYESKELGIAWEEGKKRGKLRTD